MRNLKRALSLALALVMVMSMMVVGANAVSVDDFSDGADIVNKEAVTVLTSLNVINGKDDGSFDPTGIVTRAEMAKMICVVLNGGRDPQLGEVVADSYSDTGSHWAKAYIEYCTTLGIVAGRGDGTFAPNETVTMAEAAKMLLVAIGYNASIEGYTGGNWQINTDVAANQQDLYEGVSAVNTSVDLTRDNAAQMVYNALECQMVKYEYVVATDNGVVTTRPQITTSGLGNVLEEKFNAVKVEAIVEGNEYATVNSLNYASSEDAGETYLNVVSISNSKQINSSVPQDEDWKSADGVYDVATSKDLLGQRVVVYIRYKDTVGYDEADALVIGAPIPVSSNKVVTSTDGTELADLLDDNKLETTADTVYLVNFGGYYGGLMYGGDPAGDAQPTADKDNEPTAMTKAQFDVAAQCVGVTVTLIDNNGDGDVDYALAEKASYGTVNKYTDDALRIQGLFNEDEYDAEDVVGYDDVALNDLVLFTEYGGKLYVERPEQVEAKLDSYSTSKKNVNLDGEITKWSGLNGRTPAEVIWVGDYVTSEGVLNTTANFYKDNNGYIFAAGETDESLLTYAVLLGFENQTRSGAGLGTTARAKLLLADGTVGTYDVATIGGKSVTNCTGTVIIGSETVNVPTTGEVGFVEADLYTIYSYSKNDAGAMRLVQKTEKHFDGDATPNSGTVTFTSGTSNIRYTDNTPKSGSATVTERTIFLYERKDGTYSRYQGRTAPSILSAAGGAYELNDTDVETFSIRVSTTGEALVVFLGNMDPVSEWKDNWAYVYNTKVAQNGDAYLVQAIIDGEIEEYLVDSAIDTDGTTELIQPDKVSGIYRHTIPVGLYNYTVDGNIYTLTQEHLSGGFNAVDKIVEGVRSSYIRAGGNSYTITDETLMFEARKNKTAQAITSVNTGDQVTIVYNDDYEAVYIFLTEFSYNIMNTDYQPVINAGTSDTTAKNLDTDGGLVGSIALGTFTQNNLKYQWYKSNDNANNTAADDVALTDSMGYTGSTSSTLNINKGTLTAGTYYFYCVVSNSDPDGITGTDTSAVVTVTVSAAPVEGSLRVVLPTSMVKAVLVNNNTATTTTAGADTLIVGLTKGDTVEIIGDGALTAGTHWAIDANTVETADASGILSFEMPNDSINITTASQRRAVTVDEGTPVYQTTSETYTLDGTLAGTNYKTVSGATTAFVPNGTTTIAAGSDDVAVTTGYIEIKNLTAGGTGVTYTAATFATGVETSGSKIYAKVNATNVTGTITLGGSESANSADTTLTLGTMFTDVTVTGTSAESGDVSVEGNVVTVKDGATSIDATINFTLIVEETDITLSLA